MTRKEFLVMSFIRLEKSSAPGCLSPHFYIFIVMAVYLLLGSLMLSKVLNA